MKISDLTPQEKYDLLTDDNKEIVKRRIDLLVAGQSERQQSPCSQD